MCSSSQSNDLHELFTLNETDNNKTETSAIFAGTGSNIKVEDGIYKPEKYTRMYKPKSESVDYNPLLFNSFTQAID